LFLVSSGCWRSEPRLKIIVLGLTLFAFSISGCKQKDVEVLLGPSQALVSVLADEAIKVAGPKKQISLITHDASWGPPSTAEGALKHALKKQGLTVITAKAANLGNPMLSGAIGLKAADFFEAMEKSTESGAVISLVGAPQLIAEDAKRLLAPEHPPVLVVATAMLGDKMGVRGEPLQLAHLLDSGVIQLAIIDGSDPSAKVVGKPSPSQELFSQNYHNLRKPQ
jgi:hypothetical protein